MISQPRLLPTTLLGLLAVPLSAQQVISVNFATGPAERVPAEVVLGAVPRPLWIHAETKSGALAGLRASRDESDTSGVATGAQLTWEAAVSYRYGSTDSTALTQLFRGYLDDGATSGAGDLGNYGVKVTVTDVPWAAYDVYLYVASDDAKEPGETIPYHAFEVNGKNLSASKKTDDQAHRTVEGRERWSGEGIPSIPLLEGRNYLLASNLDAKTLTIRGYQRKQPLRGSVTAIQIVERAAAKTAEKAPSTSPSTVTGGYRWGW